MKDRVTFYRSFYEAIVDLPRDIQGEICMAIMEYGLNDKDTENLKPIARRMFTLIKPVLDAHAAKVENGRKGGAPKGSRNNPNGRRGKDDSETNQELTKNKPRTNQELTDIDIDKDIDNIYSVDVKKISSNDDIKERENSLSPPPPEYSNDYKKFLSFIESKAPYINKNLKLPTEAEFMKLKAKYTGKEIADIILQIENRRDLRKRYTSLYRTLLNWLKNDFGERE